MDIDGSEIMRGFLKQGLSYPKARELAVKKIGGQSSVADCRLPNDTLAVEYIKAIMRQRSPLVPVAVRRKGSAHDSMEIGGTDIVSAGYIRRILHDRQSLPQEYIPEAAMAVFSKELESLSAPADMANAERAVLYRIKTASLSDFARLPDVTEGLENRLLRAAASAESSGQFLSAAKSKRYTMSRLRRILINLMIGGSVSAVTNPPPYIRVLGFNKHGQQLLAAKTNTLPILHSFAEISRQFPLHAAAEQAATTLFALSLPEYKDISEYGLRKHTPQLG